jgi:adenylate kinase
VIRKRFNVYKDETEPVAEYYQEHNKLERIQGEGSVDDIFQKLSESIEKEMAAQQSSVSAQ